MRFEINGKFLCKLMIFGIVKSWLTQIKRGKFIDFENLHFFSKMYVFFHIIVKNEQISHLVTEI